MDKIFFVDGKIDFDIMLFKVTIEVLKLEEEEREVLSFKQRKAERQFNRLRQILKRDNIIVR